jgi:hypothetical protein
MKQRRQFRKQEQELKIELDKLRRNAVVFRTWMDL